MALADLVENVLRVVGGKEAAHLLAERFKLRAEAHIHGALPVSAASGPVTDTAPYVWFTASLAQTVAPHDRSRENDGRKPDPMTPRRGALRGLHG